MNFGKDEQQYFDKQTEVFCFVFKYSKRTCSSDIRVYPTPIYYTGAMPNCILSTFGTING